MKERITLMYVLFFISGVPALIYQLLWQRALFTIYGVNIESVTLIVMIFMLGLGLGALIGGFLSKRFARRSLLIFALGEFAIGVYGYYSLQLFNYVGDKTIQLPMLWVGGVVFLLLLIPTLIMGATLPLLVNYVAQRNSKVGRSVAYLYFSNTAGAAFACFIAADVLFGNLGQINSLLFAAGINIVIGCSAFLLYKQNTVSVLLDVAEQLPVLPYRAALFLSVLSGFIGLAYEIVWVHAWFFNASRNIDGIAHTLGCFLLGLAFGAFVASIICDMNKGKKPLLILGVIGIIGSIYNFLMLPILGLTASSLAYYDVYALIIPGAFCLGVVLPVICDLSIKHSSATGLRVAYIYLVNIIGCTLGSFSVGFFLLDYLNMGQINSLLAVMSLMMSLLLINLYRPNRKWLFNVAILLLAIVILISHERVYRSLYARMLFKSTYHGQQFDNIIQTKSGVITLHDGIVCGDNDYNGRLNIEPEPDVNLVFRIYAISLFHPKPENVLMIGLASGSWATVLANHPQLKSLTVLEINPGYIQFIKQYPIVSPLLTNPKVNIVVDDARRWLRRHPQQKFDLIIMNTPFHWRAYTSLLLSTSFMKLAKQHVTDDGYFYFNTTMSLRAMRTAAMEFPDVKTISNMIIASFHPIKFNVARLTSVLTEYQIHGKLMFTPSSIKKFLKKLHGPGYDNDFNSKAKILAQSKGMRLITDDNMGHEWYS